MPLFLRLAKYRMVWLAVLTVVFVGWGITEPTGLTGKDEFYLGLRTPIEMMEGHHWVIPYLDGQPRLRKPPMLYWLARMSYETFGVSLLSARGLAIALSMLFVLATAGIARRLTRSDSTAFISGLVLLGCMGLATEGRRLMLDIPTAAFSAAAFWAFLAWLDTHRKIFLAVSAIAFASGLLTKGPVGAVVFGAGAMALLLCRPQIREDAFKHAGTLALFALLGLGLGASWYAYVYLVAPNFAEATLAEEMASRRFLDLSPGIVLGIFTITLPWGAVALRECWLARRGDSVAKTLALWFLLSFVPFLFIKSFERYLVGSLIPLAILTSYAITRPRPAWPFRIGVVVVLLFGGLLAFLNFRFQFYGWMWALPAMAFLAWAWWTPRHLVCVLLAPILFWASILGGLFPTFGINAVPGSVVDIARQQDVAFVDGPQPAMLSVLSGRTHRHLREPFEPAELVQLRGRQTPIFMEKRDMGRFDAFVQSQGYKLSCDVHYKTLATHGSGLRFAKIGATGEEWKTALVSGTPEPLMTEIVGCVVRP